MDVTYETCDPVERTPLLCSHRLLLAVLSFFGKLFVYSARVNLSVAIICMVRSDVTSNNSTSLGHSDSTNNDVSFNFTFTSQGRHNTGSTDLALSGNSSGFTDVFNTTTTPVTTFSSTSQHDGGEVDWDKTMQAHLLSMYFYGYILTQIPSGWLSSKFGGKKLWGFCQLIGAVATILTPLCVRTHLYLACAVRFVIGFTAGVTFPSVHSIMGRWAPPLDRSRMISISFSGATCGTIVTMATSGLLCAYGLDNGWASIFYLCGIFNLVWVAAWFFVTADSPAQHRRISTRERNYIQHAIGKGAAAHGADQKRAAIPWGKIFTSGPVWAIVFASFSSNYFNYTMLTSLPMFMKEAMKFDIKENGVLSSLPYVAQAFGGVFAGLAADKVIARRWMGVKNTRKIVQSISLLGAAVFLMAVVQVDADHRYMAVVFLCFCALLRGTFTGAYAVNHLDLAPKYAGLLFGITNTTATIPGIIAPVIAGALTPNKTAEEWRNVFYVCAAVCATGALAFVLLADGELQEWAVDEGVSGSTSGKDQQRYTAVVLEEEEVELEQAIRKGGQEFGCGRGKDRETTTDYYCENNGDSPAQKV